MENDFDIRNGMLYKYTGTSENVIIPDCVHTIYEKAFMQCATVKCIEVPHSVKRILWRAFSMCENLERLILPSSVNFISVSAIEYSVNLKEIIMEENECFYVKDNQIISKEYKDHIISTGIVK